MRMLKIFSKMILFIYNAAIAKDVKRITLNQKIILFRSLQFAVATSNTRGNSNSFDALVMPILSITTYAMNVLLI